ncbi:MAG: hypothetical protein A2161_18000 [Candidatus Schekmanbacteria bacterium RBG_13_48_7]|uniref:Uncharacterized protein n=1 Tax=Candidatus Schekmanbacteria bacterium RBG_13_48_7 TaxID=1817878 RepID=A0A1F7RHS7_9BACT|nr:MAG: hypothetical protein A2161_18000 [Candidatus Schekmanbacteria bacterium RBG_13_48_7]
MKETEGFGMWAERIGPEYFSWEWFNIEGDKGKKLQGNGNLNLKMNEIDGFKEISEIFFETDTVFRIDSKIDRPKKHDSDFKTDYLVVIKKGSYIKF